MIPTEQNGCPNYLKGNSFSIITSQLPHSILLGGDRSSTRRSFSGATAHREHLSHTTLRPAYPQLSEPDMRVGHGRLFGETGLPFGA